MKYEKSNLIHIQTKDNLVIFTHKIDTLIALTTFLKKCEKCKEGLYIRTEGVFKFEWYFFFTNYCRLEDKTEINCMLTLFPVVKPVSPLSASQAVNEPSKWKNYNFFLVLFP